MNVAGYEIDIDIFRKYAGQALPRHVSYPMPTWWNDVDRETATSMLRASRERADVHDISLYLHVPFCETVCRYCACNRVAMPRTSNKAEGRTEDYVTAVDSELATLGEVLTGKPTVRHIHWGGGTPTYLSCERLTRIHETIGRYFTIAPDAEIAIEVDPRVTTHEMLATLRQLDFNRVSLGVQDFNAKVQEHVRRIQPVEMVRGLVDKARELGFISVNFDLIYGLPYQTPETIRETIAQAIELSPDRIAYYLFAQIPDRIAAQRGLDYESLPDSETKLEMFLLGLRDFTAGGYEFVGLDHFAKPDEPLAVAKREGTLQRNFQGMTTGGGMDLIGIGASSISHLAGVGFLQNVHKTSDYVARLTEGQSPIFRGKAFIEDDLIRQAVLGQLYCEGRLRPAEITRRFGIDFERYFERELGIMRELETEGLVSCNGDIEVTLPLGRVLMRTLGAVFDAYLAPNAYREGDRQYFSANA